MHTSKEKDQRLVEQQVVEPGASSIETQTEHSSTDLLQRVQSLEKEVKSLKVMIGLFIGTLVVAAVAVGAGFAIAAAPIIVSSIIGGILATAALAALSVTAYRYRAEMGRGFKYAAGKVKDASVYTAEKAREGYYSVKGAISSVGRAAREGTGATLGKMGRSLSNLSESMSSLDAIPYSIGNEGQTVVLKTEEKTRNFNSVKEMFIKEVLKDKAVNSSALTKEIFSKLGEKILEKAYSVGGPQCAKKDQLIDQLKRQADFVNKLDAKKLQSLLAKDNNSLYEIFSDHHDEIKRIIKECKESHLYSSISNMFNKAEKRANRPSFKSLTRSISSSLSSLGRKDSTQSTSSLSESSSMSSLDSARTDSTISSEAELLDPANRKEVKQSSGFFSRFKRNETPKEATNVEYQTLSESDTSSRQVGNSTFYVAPPKPPRSSSLNSIGTGSTATVSDSGSQEFATVRRSSSSSSLTPKLTPVASPKVPESPSTDSGMGSGSSTPKSPSVGDLSKARAELKKTGYLDKLVGQPSMKVDEVKPESTQVKTVG